MTREDNKVEAALHQAMEYFDQRIKALEILKKKRVVSIIDGDTLPAENNVEEGDEDHRRIIRKDS